MLADYIINFTHLSKNMLIIVQVVLGYKFSSALRQSPVRKMIYNPSSFDEILNILCYEQQSSYNWYSLQWSTYFHTVVKFKNLQIKRLAPYHAVFSQRNKMSKRLARRRCENILYSHSKWKSRCDIGIDYMLHLMTSENYLRLFTCRWTTVKSRFVREVHGADRK